ncbi:sulfite exporter TauE/SafE family protein [Photobacterium minamisatsumaniensis]|uniref:sulfite exporter TauE/SafE family protein n=1 Tax=Photobacterium minamisatsumaniensis TaxID=2910233 RepID=UPI003D0C1265
MIELIELIKPDLLSVSHFTVLIIFSFVTSALTAVMGVGGGAMLIAVMATFMPAAAIIPVHALVQLGSNGGRCWLLRQHVRRDILLWFFVGSILGALMGGQLAFNLPSEAITLILGCFILASCWLPITRSLGGNKSMATLGGITTFLTMFIGATGPFVIASIKHLIPERRELVSTTAALMSFQHAIKALTFGLFGFAFIDWIGLIGLMVGTGFLGTLAGQYLLERFPNHQYHKILKLLLTFIAIRLIVTSALSLAQ